jgi:uncharacterized protein (UPF0261 family)
MGEINVIHLVGTMDTKAAELNYLRDLLLAGGSEVRLIDVGTRPASAAADVSAEEVARHHPGGAQTVLEEKDRGSAVAAMTRAFAAYCEAEQAGIDAIMGIGGGGGTSIITAGMRALPYGIPKLMVSTLASGDVSPYVDISDIIMVPAVTDLAGLNRISRQILHNAAQAMLGMAARPYREAGDARPSIGLTMFGVTTDAVTRTCRHLEGQYDCVVFHATGTGGRTMEHLLAEDMLQGLLDLTTTEIADELVGGVLSAGAERLDAAVTSGKPYVGSVGATDMVNFWAPDTVPERFAGRLFYRHNDNVTLMRTTPEEAAEIGRFIGEKLSRARGAVHVLLPEEGVSALDIEGGPFRDPEADQALFEALESTIGPVHRVTRLPCHINDEAFARAAAQAFVELAKEP